jgi:DNA-binding HxlR family transcriptional regulator
MELGRCAVTATLKQFATKWKPCIISYLAVKPLRYNQLCRAIPNISRKMLSQHLDELEADDLIIRTPYDRKLQHVEYQLSQKGRSLLDIFTTLEEWGLANLPGVLSINLMVDRAGI